MNCAETVFHAYDSGRFQAFSVVASFVQMPLLQQILGVLRFSYDAIRGQSETDNKCKQNGGGGGYPFFSIHRKQSWRVISISIKG